MALSEEERRLLAQMEAALAAEDPKLEHTLRGIGTRRVHGRKAAVAILGFLVGIALLIAGLQITWIVGGMDLNWTVSVLGFLVMLGSAILAIRSWSVSEAGPGSDGGGSSEPRRTPPSDHPFMDKMEERWRRRQEDGS